MISSTAVTRPTTPMPPSEVPPAQRGPRTTYPPTCGICCSAGTEPLLSLVSTFTQPGLSGSTVVFVSLVALVSFCAAAEGATVVVEGAVVEVVAGAGLVVVRSSQTSQALGQFRRISCSSSSSKTQESDFTASGQS